MATGAVVELRVIDGPAFGRTLRTVKESAGARYNPATRTWTVNDGSLILRVSERQYPYEVVKTHYCPAYTRDQGCPLHGELCAPEYR